MVWSFREGWFSSSGTNLFLGQVLTGGRVSGVGRDAAHDRLLSDVRLHPPRHLVGLLLAVLFLSARRDPALEPRWAERGSGLERTQWLFGDRRAAACTLAPRVKAHGCGWGGGEDACVSHGCSSVPRGRSGLERTIYERGVAGEGRASQHPVGEAHRTSVKPGIPLLSTIQMTGRCPPPTLASD